LVPLAIAHCGLRVRLCDTRAGHFDMDPEMLAAMCDQDTLAIVPTHLAGRVADVDHAVARARATGAWVIEDAAQAWGATVNGSPVGMQGDCAFFSLAVGKGITTYEGGVLTTRDPALRERLRATSDQIIPKRWNYEVLRLLQLLGYTALYRPLGLRLSYGIPRRRHLRRKDWIKAIGDDFSAAIPLHRVSAWRRRIGERAARRWPAYAAQLQTQASRRLARLESLPGVRVMKDAANTQGTWPFFLVLLPSPVVRDAVLSALASSRLGVSRLFVHALPDYPYLRASIDADARTPNARRFAECSLTVSNSLWLGDADFDDLVVQMADAIIHAPAAT
jgi:dTDP-4-amino-4,6-dideoxygalactose transaminase